jgi:hypothetical protein
MLTAFYDMKSVLMVEFMQQGTTITPAVYCEILKKKKLLSAYHTEQKALRVRIHLLDKFILNHKNATLHSSLSAK